MRRRGGLRIDAETVDRRKLVGILERAANDLWLSRVACEHSWNELDRELDNRGFLRLDSSAWGCALLQQHSIAMNRIAEAEQHVVDVLIALDEGALEGAVVGGDG